MRRCLLLWPHGWQLRSGILYDGNGQVLKKISGDWSKLEGDAHWMCVRERRDDDLSWICKIRTILFLTYGNFIVSICACRTKIEVGTNVFAAIGASTLRATPQPCVMCLCELRDMQTNDQSVYSFFVVHVHFLPVATFFPVSSRIVSITSNMRKFSWLGEMHSKWIDKLRTITTIKRKE